MTRMPQPGVDHAVPAHKAWALGGAPWLDEQERAARTRVIVDNDFMGDPDDLFQLVHHLLSPSVDVRLVVSSHLHEGEPWDPSDRQAANGAEVVRDVFARMGITSADRIVAGAEKAMTRATVPEESDAARAIVAEARRDDVRPLYYCAGGGLTDLAAALLMDPSIAERMTLIWIGGSEHASLAVPPPGAPAAEYNLTIDTVAAQVVFGETAVPIWQVPRDAYRQALVSMAELRVGFRPLGTVGDYLYDELRAVGTMLAQHGMNAGETYVIGDQPLVLLSALQTTFEPDAGSSAFVTIPTPRIGDEGLYVDRPDGRPMRVYTRLDNRLTLDDFRAKLTEFTAWQEER